MPLWIRFGTWRKQSGRSHSSTKKDRRCKTTTSLNRVGIPTVDVIDFDYPHWHKLSDTADKIDAAQMAEVSKVITTWLQKIK